MYGRKGWDNLIRGRGAISDSTLKEGRSGGQEVPSPVAIEGQILEGRCRPGAGCEGRAPGAGLRCRSPEAQGWEGRTARWAKARSRGMP